MLYIHGTDCGVGQDGEDNVGSEGEKPDKNKP